MRIGRRDGEPGCDLSLGGDFFFLLRLRFDFDDPACSVSVEAVTLSPFGVAHGSSRLRDRHESWRESRRESRHDSTKLGLGSGRQPVGRVSARDWIHDW